MSVRVRSLRQSARGWRSQNLLRKEQKKKEKQEKRANKEQGEILRKRGGQRGVGGRGEGVGVPKLLNSHLLVEPHA